MIPRATAACLSLLVLALPASGGICSLEDSTKSCREKVATSMGVTLKESSAAAEEAASASVAKKNTGAPEALSSGAGTKEDFRNFFQFLLDSGALGESQEDGEGGFALDVTNFFGLNVEDGYKVQVIGRQAKVSPLLEATIPEADRAGKVAELEKDLDRLSDSSIVLSYNPTGAKKARGRNPANYASEYDQLWAGVKSGFEAETNKLFAEADKLDQFLQDSGLSTAQWRELESAKASFMGVQADSKKASELLSLFENEALAFFGRQIAVGEELAKSRYFDFAKLIDNQPQWVFGLEQTYRDPLAGPDELKLKGSYEYGFANVRALKAFCAKKEELKAPEKLADCMKAYLETDTPFAGGKIEDRVNAGHRMAFTVEYSDVDDYKFDAGDDLDEVVKKGDHEVKVSLGYSRYLNLGKAIGPNTRFDLAYTYEDSGSDKAKNDRHIGQAILSIPAANKTFFTVGVKYSSDPKFVGEVDKELSTRVGLVFKPFQPEDPAKP